jgi:hypothetical protein
VLTPKVIESLSLIVRNAKSGRNNLTYELMQIVGKVLANVKFNFYVHLFIKKLNLGIRESVQSFFTIFTK